MCERKRGLLVSLLGGLVIYVEIVAVKKAPVFLIKATVFLFLSKKTENAFQWMTAKMRKNILAKITLSTEQII